MPRKGENIFKRKDGRWEARYIKEYDTYGNGKYGYVYAKSYQEVKRKRNIILTNLGAVKKDNQFTKKRFELYLDEWLECVKITVKISTYTYYSGIINKHIKPLLGYIYLTDLSDQIISRFVEKLRDNKLNYSTIRNIIGVLKQVLKFNKININIKMPRVSKKKIIILSKNDKACLEQYIYNNINGTTIGILLSLYCGLRIGEVCALKWKDIDFETNTIYVQKTAIRVNCIDKESKTKTKVIIEDAKTNNSFREIPINFNLSKILMNFKKSNEEDNFVLSSKKKNADPRNYYNQYKKILKKANVADYNYHSLRHTFATNCIELGLDAKSLSELLGHSDIKITLSLYVHPSLEVKRNFLNSKLLCNY